MFPGSGRRSACPTIIAAALLTAATASAQSPAARVPSAPPVKITQNSAPTPSSETIQTELLPGGLDARYDGEGFLFGIGTNAIYDSNLFLQDDDGESDLQFTASPWILYSNAPPGGARFILNARYAPFVRVFLENSDLNTIDHSGNLSLSYEGDKTTFEAGGSASRLSSSDRYTGTFVEASNYGVFLGGTYQISQKTALAADWSARTTDYESGRFASYDAYALSLTGFWQATPLLRIGPTIRHTQTDSSNIGEREAIAFLLSLGYSLTGKVSLTAAGGIEFEDYERGTGDTEVQFTGQLAANYVLDALWSFGASIRYQTIPSPSFQNYSIDDLGFSVRVSRSLKNGSLSAGASTSFSYYEAVGPAANLRDDEENFSLFLTHRMNLFEERVSLDSAVRFSKNSGLRDWDRFQLSTGFSYVF